MGTITIMKITKAEFVLFMGLTTAAATYLASVVAILLPGPITQPTITFITGAALILEGYFMTKEVSTPS